MELARRHLVDEGAGVMSWPAMAALVCAGWGFLVHRRLTFRDLKPSSSLQLGQLAPFLAASFTAYLIATLGARIAGESVAAVLWAWAVSMGVKYPLVRMVVRLRGAR